MRYKVIVSQEFKKGFYKLPKKVQEIAKKKLKQLETRLIGDPLKHDLTGFYSIHFFKNQYRIIYFKKGNILEVLVVQIGKRKGNFYKKLVAGLKRKSKLGKKNSFSSAYLL